MNYLSAHQLLRDICQVAATKMAMPSTTAPERAAIRNMAVAAAETVYTAVDFEQFMRIPMDEHRSAAERRGQFVEAVMQKAEHAVAQFVASLTA